MYATVIEADAYFQLYYGYDTEWLDVDEDLKAGLLLRATEALDSKFGANYLGDIFDNSQENLFPRTEFTDKNGRLVLENTIPKKLISATAELALRAHQGEDISGAGDRQGVQSESVSVGSVSTSTAYTGSGSFTEEDGPIYLMIDHLFRKNTGFGGFSVSSVTRG